MGALVKKKVRVRGKGGKSFLRSVMVRAGETAKKHGAKVVGAAALLGSAYAAHKNREALGSHAKTAMHSADVWRRSKGATLAGKLIRAGASSLVSHYGNKVGTAIGGRIGKKFGKHGKEFGEVVGGALGSATAEHTTEAHIERAAKSATSSLRRKNLVQRKKK